MTPADLADIRFALANRYEAADQQTIFKDIELLLEHIDRLQAVANAAQQTLDAAVRLQLAAQALNIHV